MKFLIAAFLFLFSTPSFASIYLNWGTAFDYPGDSQYSDVQTYALGHGGVLSKKFDYILEAGGWKDPGHFPGAKPALYTSAAIGLDLRLHEKYASYFIGPSILSDHDTILGSNYQVFHKFSFGVRDERDRRIGFFIKHWSNAGLTKINYGRNFAGLEVAF